MAVTTPAAANRRPILLSADKRKISYTSKSGKTVTVELRQSSKAIQTLRELSKRETKEDLVRKENSDGQTTDESLWPGVFDTISFWCMEAVEIACFGPYDEPPVVDSAKPVQKQTVPVAAAAA